jgi:hypothetical protein
MAIDLKKSLVYLIIAFVIVSIWTDPHGSSRSIGIFLSHTGHFLAELIDRGAQFISGLIH